jgi:hypothetical protein
MSNAADIHYNRFVDGRFSGKTQSDPEFRFHEPEPVSPVKFVLTDVTRNGVHSALVATQPIPQYALDDYVEELERAAFRAINLQMRDGRGGHIMDPLVRSHSYDVDTQGNVVAVRFTEYRADVEET